MSSVLAVDFRWMHGQLRGMGRYAHELLCPVKHICTALVPTGNKLPIKHEARGWSFFPWWEQVELPALVKQRKYRFLFCPYNTAPLWLPSACQLVLVVHDLIYLKSWFELPPSISLYQTMGRLYRRWIVPKVVRRANYLLTVSEFTKNELVSTFDIKPERIIVIPNSLPDDWLIGPPQVCEREDYIFSVAGQAPSKNVTKLLQAFAKMTLLTTRPCKLVIAGIGSPHHKHFIDLATRLNIVNSIVLLGFISELELRDHYRRCSFFIFPSLYEGFGIPLLEAMACGAPIACSNTTSMPEVVLDSAIMFDPRSVDGMTKSMLALFNNSELRENIAARGLERVKRYMKSNVMSEIKEFWGSIGAS